MREPDFWRRDGVLADALSPLAAIYGAIAARRMRQTGARAAVPVLCVGNLTAGGAGKTPTAIAIAKLLIAAHARPMFLTRGYGGSLSVPMRVTPAHSGKDVGDEPLLLARVAPTAVARDRVAGAMLAPGSHAGVIVMDDGFQNPSLAKDLSLIVIDGARGIGNGRVIPSGPLRAPLAAQLKHAGALIVVGKASGATELVLAAARAAGLPLFNAALVPDANVVASLRRTKNLAFAGIAYPDKFFATLASAGVDASVTRAFPDHHRFTRAQANELLAEAKRKGLSLVTTEKDLARLRGDRDLAQLAESATALPVTMQLQEEAALRALILARLKLA